MSYIQILAQNVSERPLFGDFFRR